MKLNKEFLLFVVVIELIIITGLLANISLNM